MDHVAAPPVPSDFAADAGPCSGPCTGPPPAVSRGLGAGWIAAELAASIAQRRRRYGQGRSMANDSNHG